MPLRALLIDLSGTLHIGSQATPRAAEALRRLRESGLPLRFLSNTTKQSRASLLETLHKLNLDVREDELQTSLSSVRDLCVERKLRCGRLRREGFAHAPDPCCCSPARRSTTSETSRVTGRSTRSLSG